MPGNSADQDLGYAAQKMLDPGHSIIIMDQIMVGNSFLRVTLPYALLNNYHSGVLSIMILSVMTKTFP